MSVYKNGVLVPVAPATHGAAEHTDITRKVFLPANEGYAQAGTLGGGDTYSTVEGGIGADEPVVYFSMKVPDDFVSFTSVKAIWLCEGTGNMHWQSIVCYAACEQEMDTHTDMPALGVTASGGENIINCQEPANPLTLTNLTLGDFIGIVFNREGSHVNDTLDESMYLLGLLFTYVANQ